MKVSILLITFFLISCNYSINKQQKAEVLIRKYLLQTLTFPANYRPLKYSQLDSAFATYHQTIEYKLLRIKLDSLEELNSYFHLVNRASPKIENELATFRRQDSINESSFKLRFSGWTLIHDFKARENKAIIKVSCKFTFDRNVDYIMDVQYNN
jgi:hypothetical protein